ncbi:Transcriptional regulator, MarR family [Actinosynnema pretiosum subsp. pretiosum]|nr:Transcriptional regulator, MarR family [Actinosynnema pretiosum subsp. pretiosum]
MLEAGVPGGVGDGRADDRDVARGEHRGAVERRRWAFEGERGDEQHGAARDQLPGRDGQDADGALRAPALGEQVAERRGEHGGGGDEHAERVDRAGAGGDHQDHARDARDAAEQGGGAGAFGEQWPGEGHHRERRGGHDRRGGAGGQELRGGVDEGEEDAHGERAQDRRAPPPVPARQAAGDREQEQSGGQGAQGRAPQRGVGGQEVVGDVVDRAPGQRGDGGDQGPAPGSFPGSNFHGSNIASTEAVACGAVDHTPRQGLDRVARIQAEWARERPDVDVSPQGVIGRLHRLAAALMEEISVVYRRHGLGEGEFDVLAALRRAGEPYERAPGELAQHTMVTTGAITKRLDRLERDGLVTRRMTDGDGRRRVVALTEAGKRVFDRAFTEHMANERRLLELLDPEEARMLEGLLERWLRHFD